MHAIEENQRTLYDGTRITTYSRAIESANVLEAEAGTTGYMGEEMGRELEEEMRGEGADDIR